MKLLTYIAALVLAAGAAMANDLIPYQQDSGNNATFPSKVSASSMNAGTVAASVSLDSTGNFRLTNSYATLAGIYPHGVWGTNGNFYTHNQFGDFMFMDTNGIGISNHLTGVTQYLFTTTTNSEIQIVGSITNTLAMPTNPASNPTWNGVALSTSSGGIPNGLITNGVSPYLIQTNNTPITGTNTITVNAYGDFVDSSPYGTNQQTFFGTPTCTVNPNNAGSGTTMTMEPNSMNDSFNVDVNFSGSQSSGVALGTNSFSHPLKNTNYVASVTLYPNGSSFFLFTRAPVIISKTTTNFTWGIMSGGSISGNTGTAQFSIMGEAE